MSVLCNLSKMCCVLLLIVSISLNLSGKCQLTVSGYPQAAQIMGDENHECRRNKGEIRNDIPQDKLPEATEMAKTNIFFIYFLFLHSELA